MAGQRAEGAGRSLWVRRGRHREERAGVCRLSCLGWMLMALWVDVVLVRILACWLGGIEMDRDGG